MSCKTPFVSDGHLRDPNGMTVLDSPDWFAWLADDAHHTFHFEDSDGGFTARKERKQRGQWYWIAYRQVHKKLYKTYLGKSETLTQIHLHNASHTLTEMSGESKPSLDTPKPI